MTATPTRKAPDTRSSNLNSHPSHSRRWKSPVRRIHQAESQRRYRQARHSGRNPRHPPASPASNPPGPLRMGPRCPHRTNHPDRRNRYPPGPDSSQRHSCPPRLARRLRPGRRRTRPPGRHRRHPPEPGWEHKDSCPPHPRCRRRPRRCCKAPRQTRRSRRIPSVTYRRRKPSPPPDRPRHTRRPTNFSPAKHPGQSSSRAPPQACSCLPVSPTGPRGRPQTQTSRWTPTHRPELPDPESPSSRPRHERPCRSQTTSALQVQQARRPPARTNRPVQNRSSS